MSDDRYNVPSQADHYIDARFGRTVGGDWADVKLDVFIGRTEGEPYRAEISFGEAPMLTIALERDDVLHLAEKLISIRRDLDWYPVTAEEADAEDRS